MLGPRQLRLKIVWWLLPGAAMLVWVFLVPHRTTAQIIGGQVAVYVVLFAAIGLSTIPMLRGYRRLRKLEGRMCLNCGFDLRGLDESGACPECGSHYSLEDRKRWIAPPAAPSPSTPRTDRPDSGVKNR